MSLGDSIASSLRRGDEMKEVLEQLLKGDIYGDEFRKAAERAKFLVDDLAWDASEHECCDHDHDLTWCACCKRTCLQGRLEAREAAKS
jgi:hypothetical protein